MILQIEEKVKNVLAEKLKEALQDVFNKLKNHVDDRYNRATDLIKRAEDIANKLRDLHVQFGEKTRQAFESLKQKFGDKFQALLEKIKSIATREKRDVVEEALLMQLESDVLEMETLHKVIFDCIFIEYV